MVVVGAACFTPGVARFGAWLKGPNPAFPPPAMDAPVPMSVTAMTVKVRMIVVFIFIVQFRG